MSTIKNIEIIGTGTLADFFTQIKEKILANTNFELISEDTEKFTLIFDTKLSDLKLKITDAQITNNSATSSCQIKGWLVSENLNIDTNSTSDTTNAAQYSSGNFTKDQVTTRKLNLLVYENDKFSFVCLRPYSSNSWLWDRNTLAVGKILTKKIVDSSSVERIFFNTTCYDISKSNSNLYLLNLFNGIGSSGIGIIEQTLSTNYSNSSGSINEICENLYNCTSLASGYKYNINGKTFFAISTNILIEV